MFQQQANIIGNVLKKKAKGELKSLCGVSDALSVHVKDIYNNLLVDNTDHALSVGTRSYHQAALMFDGPAFRGLAARDLSPDEFCQLQKHLRILTGLYGLVKPGDLIQEHRLCMGTKLAVDEKHRDLYSFWGEKLAQNIVNDLHEQLATLHEVHVHGERSRKGNKSVVSPLLTPPLVVNCASQEYAKSVLPHLNTERVNSVENIRVVECVFLDGGIVKSAFAKRARGEKRRACSSELKYNAMYVLGHVM